MRPWHLTISSVSRLALFPGAGPTREALWRLVEILGEDLALSCIVDDHVHAVILCDEPTLKLRVAACTAIWAFLKPTTRCFWTSSRGGVVDRPRAG